MAVTLAYAKAQLKKYSCLVDEYRHINADLEHQYEELMRLKALFEAAQSELRDCRNRLERRFRSLFSNAPQLRVMQAYRAGMGNTISEDCEKSFSRISQALWKIDEKRSELLRKIDSNDSLRNAAMNEMNYWLNTVQTLLSAETGG